jgi:ribonuclease P protein component
VAAAAKSSRRSARWCGLKRADFPSALGAPVLGKSIHFALHHLAAVPASARSLRTQPLVPELSTDTAPIGTLFVDNDSTSGNRWLGLVVPKRHAKRAVTRSLIKRQMRMHAEAHRHHLPPGQWVIRLRAPFDPRRYASAASSQLSKVAGAELGRIFASVSTG